MEKKDFNILYVDDEEQNLVSFKATFRRDYNIYTATSGEEGLKIVRDKKIQLIITDQRMPGMTGVQFLEKIVPEFPDTIRMIITGFSDIEVVIEAINSGRVFRYITKPWDENELRMTIENARQMFHLQVKNRELLNQLRVKVAEQEKTLKIFMQYVPEPVVQKALSTTGESILDGESIDVAVLFCDIRDFTPMSEELSPPEVVNFLNDYYSLMTSIVKKHNGMVCQFVGDEIFAVFGAPLSYPNNEENAVFCAIEMMKNLAKLNDTYSNKFKRVIQIGIGINYGEVVAGNLGSEDKIEFAVTGDTVNTGKRIEMLTKTHPDSILISENVFNKTREYIDATAWEPLHVKGKKEKIHVYEVKGRKNTG